jgi:valyl-tRNA synthetase
MHRADAAPGDAAATRAATLSRYILYLCLDRGLKLLHPFMPFVTEELWHRLPGRGAPWRADGSSPDPPSIMIAPFPVPIAGCNSPPVEAAFQLFQAAVRAGRGLRQQCDLLPKVRAGGRG